MQVQHTNENEYHIIAIKGDVDASSSIILDNALEKAIHEKYPMILIDCSELSYISSPGIGVFTSRLDDCENVNIRLVLFAMRDKVQNVFRILGLDQLIQIVETKEEAKSVAK
jgi:anti-sigma B factor antagonist